MNMTFTKNIENLVGDLKRFTQVCAELKSGQASLAQIARKLGMSTSGLWDCLDRLGKKVGAGKVIETHPNSKFIKITSSGEHILQQSHRIFEAIGDFERSAKEFGEK